MTSIETDHHALYRFHDAAGQLLYVGLTSNPGRRFAQHASDKPWWTEVATVRIETFPDRASVALAERVAIQAERPRYNVVHARPTGSPPDVVAVAPDVAGEWPVAVGDVVALGLDHDECRVGKVEAVTAFGPKLALLSWLSGFFDEEVVVPWGRVQEVRHGYPMSPGQARRAGYAEGIEIYDCDPLGDFQTFWSAGRGERGRAALRQARMDQRGWAS